MADKDSVTAGLATLGPDGWEVTEPNEGGKFGSVGVLTAAELGAMKLGANIVPGAGGMLSRPTWAAAGTSLVAQCQTFGAANLPGACPYYAHLQMAMAYLGNPWAPIDTSAQDGVIPNTSSNCTLRRGLLGYSTGTSAQIDPLYDAYIGAYKPNFCFLAMWDNDTTGTVEATSTVIARAIARIDSIIAQGTVPIVIAAAPSTSINSSLLQARYWTIHRGIEAAVSARPSVIYVPLYSLYTDTSATWGPQPLNSGIGAGFTDGIHPRVIGIEIGRFIAQHIARRVAIQPLALPTPGSPQLINLNPLLAGTLAGGSGITGNGPASCNTSSTLTTATVTCSKVLLNGKEVLQVDISTSGAQTGFKEAFQMNQGPITTGWAVGDLISLLADIEFDPSVAMAGIRCPQLLIGFTGAVTSYPGTGGQMLGYASGGDTLPAVIKPGERMRMMTQPVPVPNSGSDAVTAVRPYFYLQAASGAAAVTCRMWVHSFAVLNLSK